MKTTFFKLNKLLKINTKFGDDDADISQVKQFWWRQKHQLKPPTEFTNLEFSSIITKFRVNLF